MKDLTYLAQKSKNTSDSDSDSTVASDSDSTVAPAGDNNKKQGGHQEPPSGKSTAPKPPAAKSLVIRKRKKDPLAYSMVNEKNSVTEFGGLLDTPCPTCGPPFPSTDVALLLGKTPCSFQCGKRFVEQVLAFPNGFMIKHANSIPYQSTEPHPMNGSPIKIETNRQCHIPGLH
jgi:hypothetical protein